MHRIIFGAALLVAQPALAQHEVGALTETAPRCWMGSASFSPGVVIRASNDRMLCTVDLIWERTDAWAAGCLREGDFYSVGAVENVPNQPMTIACQEDGTWLERAATE